LNTAVASSVTSTEVAEPSRRTLNHCAMYRGHL
jgi:hypothetical protein